MELSDAIRKFLEYHGFAVQLGGIVIIMLYVPGHEACRLDQREREDLYDLQLGEKTLSVASWQAHTGHEVTDGTWQTQIRPTSLVRVYRQLTG